MADKDYIFENLENMTSSELLEISKQLSDNDTPSADRGWEAFKRDYLPTASDKSLYDEDTNVPRNRIKPKSILAVAAIVVLIAASSLVSYAAGAASNGSRNADNAAGNAQSSEKEELKTTVEIDGLTKELYIIKPLEDFDRTEYIPSKSVDDQSLTKMSGNLYSMAYHYADVDGNVLRFEQIPSGELRDGMMKKATEMYGADFVDYMTGDPFIERSDIFYRREEAGDYYCEFFAGSNYVIESFDPFLQIHKKIFANYDTNFQMETTMSIYAKCYNAEKDEYQEFIVSKTDIGSFEVVFDAPEGWLPVEADIVIENSIIGKGNAGLSAFMSEEESPSELREKINAALEKYQREKEEKSEVINKIESEQNK